MNYDEALEHLKRGEKISRDGKVFRLGYGAERGLHVSRPDGTTERVYFSEEDRAADDWSKYEEPQEATTTTTDEELAPEPVSPETVDEVLSESAPQ